MTLIESISTPSTTLPNVPREYENPSAHTNCPNTGTTLCTTNVMCTTDIGGPLVTPAGLIGVASTTECGGMVTFLI